MDRYKEGYADCNREWEKKIQEVIKKHEEERDLAGERLTTTTIIADSDSLNYGRIQTHNVTIKDLQDLLKKG